MEVQKVLSNNKFYEKGKGLEGAGVVAVASQLTTIMRVLLNRTCHLSRLERP